MKNNLLQIKGFNMAFGENVLFSNFDYEFKPGIYVFSGPSGVGKSTLMRIIAGLETRYTGDIILNGTKIEKTTPQVHMMHQHYTSFPWLNVLKNTLMVYKGHKIKPNAEDIDEAKMVLSRLGLGEHLDKLPSQISGGQDQRLSFASTLVNKWSPVILYDEPTSALDMLNDMLIVEMIKEHQKRYNTIEIVITHEEHVVEALDATVLEFTPEFRLRPASANALVIEEQKKKSWFEQLRDMVEKFKAKNDSEKALAADMIENSEDVSTDEINTVTELSQTTESGKSETVQTDEVDAEPGNLQSTE